MSEIRPAATVVIARDSSNGLEVLLLRRHQQMNVGAGSWVFPGGVVDPEDFAGDSSDEYAAASRAAVRETLEEAALNIADQQLQFISHWTTPPPRSKRFATWFFLAEATSEEVVVDGEEMDLHRWVSPADALAEHRSDELSLMPPTVVTLTELDRCGSLAAARAFYEAREVPYIAPRMAMQDDRICMLYQGDAGYEAVDMDAPGARHRCWLEDNFWRYECDELP